MALKSVMLPLLLAVSVAGCGKVIEKVVPGYSTAQKTTAPAPDLNTITRAQLAQAGQPVLRMKMPSRGLDTLLVVRDSKANVTSWRTDDGRLFTFRDGILIETRGFGADLMSSAAPAPGQIRRLSGNHGRSYFYMGLDDQVERRDYLCITEDRGISQTVIQGQGIETRHIVELCDRAGGFRVTNEYWLDGDMIRRSLQWAGPAIGMVEFQRVID